MANENHAVLAIVLDESGSMQGQMDFVVDGFNEFLDEQRNLDNEATLFRTTFNHEYPPNTVQEPLQEASELTDDSYNPGGRTALFDAVCYTIVEAENWIGELPEDDQPENILVAIVTDGKENSSEEHSLEDVKSRIGDKKEEGWEFIYIGAGIEDFNDPDSMGLDTNRSRVRNDTKGYSRAFQELHTASRNVRRSGTVGNYQEEAEKQMTAWDLSDDEE